MLSKFEYLCLYFNMSVKCLLQKHWHIQHQFSCIEDDKEDALFPGQHEFTGN